MREFGFIKWFGGVHDVPYGFIECVNSNEDLFVHKRQLRCDSYDLYEGQLVTFEVGEHRGKKEAKIVKTIDMETDLDCLQTGLSHQNEEIRVSSLTRYLECLPEQELQKFILEQLPNGILKKRVVFHHISPTFYFEQLEAFIDHTPYDEILSKSIWYLVNKSTSLPLLLREKLAACLQRGLFDRSEIKKIPIEFFIDNLDLVVTSHYDGRITILLELSNHYPERMDDWVQLVRETIEQNIENADEIWKRIPSNLLKNEPLWSLAPIDVKISAMDEKQIVPEHRELLEKWLFEKQDFNEKKRFVKQLPPIYQVEDPFLPYLEPIQQLEHIWNPLTIEPLKYWNRLSEMAKAYAIMRVAKEQIEMNHITALGEKEQNRQMKALLLLLWSKSQNDSNKRAALKRAHALIQADILDQAIRSDEKLNIYRLLPICSHHKVPYCEGKPWLTKEDKELGITEIGPEISQAYCPRTGSSCTCNIYPYYRGAILFSNQERDWQDWSLLELLDNCGITNSIIAEAIPDIRMTPGEYVNRLAGWVNRLEEIRERLKCSYCQTMMISNFQYSKHLARYNMTVVSCQHGYPHDQNIYLNHCWGCREIIDSRQNKIRLESYYLCTKCGSGPPNHPTFHQGDICPHCGKEKMVQHPQNKRIFTCNDCNHQIYTPVQKGS